MRETDRDGETENGARAEDTGEREREKEIDRWRKRLRTHENEREEGWTRNGHDESHSAK